MQSAVSLKSRSKTYGNNLWKLYKSSGISGYLSLNYSGPKSPLSEKEEFWRRLQTEGFSSIKAAQLWIFEKYGLRYTENGLGNFFRHRKIKLKTG